MAVLQTWPTLGVSWGKGAYPCYVWPNWQGRTGHIPSIHSYSAWCIYEGTEEKEAGWGQYPGRVDYAAWLRAARSGAWHVFGWPDDTSGSCSQPVVLPSLVTSSGGRPQQGGTQGFSLYIACAFTFWHSSTRRGRRQVLFNYNLGSSRICGVLTDGSDMAYLISSTLRNMLGWLSLYTSMQCWAS